TYAAQSNRRLGMRILAGLVTWRNGQRFTDTTSGFRAVGPRALALFAEEYPADFPEVETLVLAVRRGMRLVEVPVKMHPRQSGRSSIAGLRSAYYMARVASILLIGQPTPVKP
ncbi:MAG: glycosyltransferase family 2 protein, partial [Acidimicrobiales bacterium]